MVYADILFFLNALFDSILLITTAVLWKEKTSFIRIFTAVLIGAIPLYSLLFSQFLFFNSFLGKFLISLVMILIAFKFVRLLKFIKLVSTLYFISFFAGGTITALQNLFISTGQWQGFLFLNENGVQILFVLLFFPVSIMFYKKHIGSIQLFSMKSDVLVPVIVTINNIEIKMKGLIDTGNQLTEPLTGIPVAIMNASMLHRMLPEEIVCSLHDQKELISVIAKYEEWRYRFTFMPFKVVGKENNMLTCLKPDGVKIFYEDKWLVCKRVYVGLNSFSISNQEEFQIILHPKLLTIHSHTA